MNDILATGLPNDESDDDLLTRAEASAYLARYSVSMKPATLARLWSVGGDGPPCRHIRRRPFYPRAELRDWALRQRSSLRASKSASATFGGER